MLFGSNFSGFSWLKQFKCMFFGFFVWICPKSCPFDADSHSGLRHLYEIHIYYGWPVKPIKRIDKFLSFCNFVHFDYIFFLFWFSSKYFYNKYYFDRPRAHFRHGMVLNAAQFLSQSAAHCCAQIHAQNDIYIYEYCMSVCIVHGATRTQCRVDL